MDHEESLPSYAVVDLLARQTFRPALCTGQDTVLYGGQESALDIGIDHHRIGQQIPNGGRDADHTPPPTLRFGGG